jgi:hypothetical protein
VSEVTITLARLPGVREGGPFHFTFDQGAYAAVLTIPIVHRGPESYAVSRAQEQWVLTRYPELECVFAGAWRTADRARLDAIKAELRHLAASK